LKKFPDFSRIAKKFQKNRATLQVFMPLRLIRSMMSSHILEFEIVLKYMLCPQDCVRVYQAVGRMQELVTSLDGCQDDHRPLINELFIAPLQVSVVVYG
jgi:hypothetical protein